MQRNAVLIDRIARSSAKVDEPLEVDVDDSGERVDDTMVRLNKEEMKLHSFWVGVTSIVESYRYHLKKPEREPGTFVHSVQHEVPRKTIIFDPNGRFRTVWDLLLSLLLLYSIIVIPYRVGFDVTPNSRENAFDNFISAMFGMDILIQANSSYLDQQTEKWVFSRKQIIRHYFATWLWVDILATVPFDGIADMLEHFGVQYFGALRLIRALRLVRIVKLYNMTKSNRHMEKLHINPTLLSLLGVIVQIFFIAHVFACFWHYISMEDAVGIQETTWVQSFDYVSRPKGARYVASLYYIVVTMLTIGYGDIYATNELERVYAIATMIVGGVVFGALVARVAAAIDKRNPQEQAFNKKMYELKLFLSEVGVSIEVRDKAKSAYSYYLQKKSSYQEQGVFEDLPPFLLKDLVYQIYEGDISRIAIFKNLEHSFVVQLIIHSRPCQAKVGDVIFAEGDICNDIVFVKEGCIRIDTFDGKSDVVSGYVTEGDMFGDAEFYVNAVALVTYRAIKYTQLLFISHTDVRQAMEDHFRTSLKMEVALKQRYENLIHVVRSKSSARKLESVMSDASIDVSNKKQLQRMLGKQDNHTHEHHFMFGHHKDINRDVKVRKLLYYNGDLINPFSSVFKVDLAPEHTTSKMLRVLDPEQDNVAAHHHGRQRVVDWHDWQLKQAWLIHPEGKMKLIWDFFIAALIIYSVMVIPVEIAFQEHAFSQSNTVNLYISLAFFVDIILSFRTCGECKDHEALIVSNRHIIGSYLKMWFWIDIISCIPFDDFLNLLSTERTFSGLQITQVLKIVRMFRLLRILRVAKLGVYLDKVEDHLSLSPVFFELFGLLAQVFFIVHISCCIWWGLTASFSDDPWYGDAIDLDSSLRRKYLLAIYFTFTTMSTVGYGDLHPQAVSSEQILGCFLVVLGASVFGYMIANVSSVLNAATGSGSSRAEKVNEISEYLEEKKCPEKLAKKIVNHFDRRYAEQSSFDVDGITNCFPPVLRVKTLETLYEKKLNKIPIFSHIQNRSVAIYIYRLLVPSYYEEGRVVIKEGENADDLIFLVSGLARAFKVDSLDILKEFHVPSLHDEEFGIYNDRDEMDDDEKKLHRKRLHLRHLIDPQVNSHEQKEQESLDILADWSFGLMPSPIDDDNRVPSIKYQENPFRKLKKNETIGNVKEEKKSKDSKKSKKKDKEKVSDKDIAIDEKKKKKEKKDKKEKKEKKEKSDGNAETKIKKEKADKKSKTKKPKDETASNSFDLDHQEQRLGADPTAVVVLNSTQILGQSSPNRHSLDLDDDKNAGIAVPSNGFVGNGDSSKLSSETVSTTSSSVPFFLKWFGRSKQADTEEWPKSFSKLQEADFLEAGFVLLGDVSPGDFVGHIAFMSNCPHDATVRTVQPSTIYTLPKTEISKLIRTEPSVGIQLQAAIARAVIAQASEVGRFHMRKSRAQFLTGLKKKYLTKKNQEEDEIAKLKLPAAAAAAAAVNTTSNKRGSFLNSREDRWERDPKIVDKVFTSKKVWYDSDDDVVDIFCDDDAKSKKAKQKRSKQNNSINIQRTVSMSEIIPGRTLGLGSYIEMSTSSSRTKQLIRAKKMKFANPNQGNHHRNGSHKANHGTESGRIIQDILMEDETNKMVVNSRLRRQSFPSLDNRVWKEHYIHQGVV